MQVFTVDDVAKLSGVTAQAIRNLVAAGIIAPAQPGQRGTGRGHRFGMSEAFALALGKVYKEEGATTDRANGVMFFLSRVPVDRLEAHFKAGRTFPVPAMLLGDKPQPESCLPGIFIEPPADPAMPKGAKALMDRLDPRPVLQKIKARAENLALGRVRKSDGRRHQSRQE